MNAKTILFLSYYLFINSLQAQVPDTLPQKSSQKPGILSSPSALQRDVVSSDIKKSLRGERNALPGKQDTIPRLKRANDTLKGGVSQSILSKDSLDAEVDYGAKDSMIFNRTHDLVYLYNKAHVKYKSYSLTADYIVIDLKTNVAHASGARDTSGKYVGLPVYKDGGQEFTTDSMAFNFRTKKGIVYNVTTKQNDVYVHGSLSKFAASDSKDTANKNDIAYSQDAIFTTCNLPHPHFGIHSSRQKVIANKMIVVGPSRLIVGDVPTPLWLPFGYFPLTKNKQSGLLIPKDYTYAPDRGYGLLNIGYYFPLGPHYDLKLTGDIYWNGTFRLGGQSSYLKRYRYNGNFKLDYNDIVLENALANKVHNTSYHLTWSHSQDQRANPLFSFNANVNIETNNAQQNYYSDYKSVTTNTLTSSASFIRNFPGQPYTLSASFQHSQNVTNHEMDIVLPSLDFQLQTIFPFRQKKRIGEEQWYEKIAFQYTGNLQNRVHTLDTTLFKSSTWSDSTNFGVKHSLNTNVNFTIFKYFNLTPSIQYSEFWYLKRLKQSYNPTILTKTDTIYNRDSTDRSYRSDTTQFGKTDTTYEHGFYRVSQFTASASLSTRIFGTLNSPFKNGWFRAIRHTLNPSFGFSYSPDYSRLYSDSVLYDTRYPNTPRGYSFYQGNLFSAPTGQKQLALGYSFSNLFELKYHSKADSSDHKIKLLDNIQISGNYNFAADSFQWSRVGIGTGTNLFGGLTSIGFAATFDPYAMSDQGVRLQTLNIVKNHQLLRFDGLNLSINTRFSIGQIADFFVSKENRTKSAPIGGDENLIDLFRGFGISHNFNISSAVVPGSNRTAFSISNNTIGTQGNIQLTKKWTLQISNIGYDFARSQLTYPDFGLYRDLHCWEAGVNYQPIRGTYTFYLRVKPGSLNFINIPYKKINSDVPYIR